MAHAIKDAVFIHVFIHFFIHSFLLKYLLSIYYVPDSMLNARIRAKTNIYKVPTLVEFMRKTYSK